MPDETYVPWSAVTQTGLGDLQQSGVPQYERTRQFRVYEPGVVPGLLQTESYATALMGLIIPFYGMPDDTEAAVAGRLRRQRVLHEGEHEFHILVEEAVLRARIGGAKTMAAQLDHLRDATSMPRVRFGVIPMSADRAMWPTTGFYLFDEAEAKVELPDSEVTVTTTREVEIYARTHAALSAMAVYDAHARALIEDARAALG